MILKLTMHLESDQTTLMIGSPHQMHSSVPQQKEIGNNRCFSHKGGSIRTYKVSKALSLRMSNKALMPGMSHV